MPDNEISRVSPNGTALNTEHYQTFEMAKANDDVLASDNISQIRSYAAYARAQAQAIHKTIAATSGIDDVAAIKAEATETAQTFAKVGIYADQRIGEILRELPKAKNQHDSLSSVQDKQTKTEAIEDAGITRSQAYDLQKMAANPEVVEAVIAKAEQDGRVVSRKQVLDAIKEKRDAERERDMANRELDAARQNLADAYRDGEMRDAEVAQLKRQLAERPDPEVVEREVVREVVPDDYESLKRKASDLKDDVKLYSSENKRLISKLESTRRELEMAKSALGSDERSNEVQRDVRYLINATDNYVKQYGGLTWTFEQLSTIDDRTMGELRLAVKNLATFSSAMLMKLEELNGAK